MRLTCKLFLAALLTAGALAISRAPGRAAEFFPQLTINGDVHTNVTVVRATPAEVILRWECGGGGAYKRQELPRELAVRYPYDQEAAEQWACEKAANDRRLAEQNRANAQIVARVAEQKRAQVRERVLQDLQRKETELNSQVSSTKKQLRDLEDVIRVLDGKANGTRRNSLYHLQADQARNQELALLDQVHQLESQLSAVQDQISRQR